MSLIHLWVRVISESFERRYCYMRIGYGKNELHPQARQLLKNACQGYLVHNKAQLDGMQVSLRELLLRN